MKKNFKYLVAGHLVAIVVFGVLLFFTKADAKIVLVCMVTMVMVSLVAQLLMYKAKPAAFDDKVRHHPNQS